MRLKSSEGPLSINSNNGNPDILNSPKRINTLQNSNITSNIVVTQDVITSLTTTDGRLYSNVNADDPVQWCNSPQLQQRNREITNNANNRNQRFNINNTLDTTLTDLRRETASSVCSESSPDDSLLDYEGTHLILNKPLFLPKQSQ